MSNTNVSESFKNAWQAKGPQSRDSCTSAVSREFPSLTCKTPSVGCPLSRVIYALVDFKLRHSTILRGWLVLKHVLCFASYSTLVANANQWLKQNPAWTVKTCESVEFKVKSEGINTEKMTYLEHGKQRMYYLRCLRLWIVPRFDQTYPTQQLAYLNLVPNMLESGGYFSKPTYERLDQLISRYNSEAHFRPAPGRLLAVESQEMKDKSSGFDPDRSHWCEAGDVGRNFLFVIRLFFEVGPPVSEEIGLADFVPKIIEPEGCMSAPKCEPFDAAVAQARDWCSRQSTVRFCNAQTLEIQCRGGVVDTQEMSYTERTAKVALYYIRILRVAYVNELTSGGQGYTSQRPPLNLQCKTFVPVQLTEGRFLPDFETLSQTKRRVEDWARMTGARVLSCETPAMRLSQWGDPLKYINMGYTKKSGEAEHWIFVLRLYLDGSFQDPPPGEMPPIPELREVSSCHLV